MAVKRSLPIISAIMLSYILCAPSLADGFDPFGASKSAPQIKPKVASCDSLELSAELSLSTLIDFALCNNPSAKSAWVEAAIKAENLALAKSQYLPTANLSAKTSASKDFQKNGQYLSSYGSSIDFSYLLYDFGARESNLEYAKQTLSASILSANFAVETIFLEIADAYYDLFAKQASLEAYLEAERSANKSYEAARAKHEAGAATPLDKLQAMTAYSQASLNVIKAKNDLKNARGALSAAIGLEAFSEVKVARPSLAINADTLVKDAKAAIDEAKKNRADMKAAEAAIEAAKALEAKERADGKGSISLSMSGGYDDSSKSYTQKSGSIGAYLNIPLFTGFSSTYKIRAAKLQIKQKELEYERLQKQIALASFKAYNELVSKIESLKSAKDLVESAKLAEKTADGRYRAGVGNMLDLISSQSSLASANQQYLDALYGVYKAKTALSYAIGKLGASDIQTD